MRKEFFIAAHTSFFFMVRISSRFIPSCSYISCVQTYKKKENLYPEVKEKTRLLFIFIFFLNCSQISNDTSMEQRIYKAYREAYFGTYVELLMEFIQELLNLDTPHNYDDIHTGYRKWVKAP